MIYHLDPIQLQSVGPTHTSAHEITLQNPSNDTVVANMQFTSLHETRANVANSIQVQIEDKEQQTLLSKNTLKQFAQTKEIIPLGIFLPNQEKKFTLSITTPDAIPETNQLQQAVFSIQTTFETQQTQNSSPTPTAIATPTPATIHTETVPIASIPTPTSSPEHRQIQTIYLTQDTTPEPSQQPIETYSTTNPTTDKKTETLFTNTSFFIGISLVLVLLFCTGILFILMQRNRRRA